MYFSLYSATFSLVGAPGIAAWEVTLDDAIPTPVPWANCLVRVTAGETPGVLQLVVQTRNVTYATARFTVASYEGAVQIVAAQQGATEYYQVSVYWNGALLDGGDGYTAVVRSSTGPRYAGWYLGQRSADMWARMTATELRAGTRVWTWPWDASSDLTYWKPLGAGPTWVAEVTGGYVQPAAVDDQCGYYRRLTDDTLALSSRRPGMLEYLYWINDDYLAEEAALLPRRAVDGGGLIADSVGISYPVAPPGDMTNPSAWVTMTGRRCVAYQRGSDVYYRCSDDWSEVLMLAGAQSPYLVHLEPTEDLMLFYHDGGSTLRAVRLYWNGAGYTQGDAVIVTSDATAERGDAVALPTGDVLCLHMGATSGVGELWRGSPLGDTWERVIVS